MNIGEYGGEKGELSRPISAAIYQNIVYVTDTMNNRISVFTTMGEFITTFGEGVLAHPECIATDDDGYLFVSNNRQHLIKFCIIV